MPQDKNGQSRKDPRNLIIDVEVEEVDAEDYVDGRRRQHMYTHQFQPARMTWKMAIILRLFFALLWVVLSFLTVGTFVIFAVTTVGWYLTGKTNFKLNTLRSLFWVRFWGGCLGTMGCFIGVLSPTIGIAFMAMYLFTQDAAMPGSNWFDWMRNQL